MKTALTFLAISALSLANSDRALPTKTAATPGEGIRHSHRKHPAWRSLKDESQPKPRRSRPNKAQTADSTSKMRKPVDSKRLGRRSQRVHDDNLFRGLENIYYVPGVRPKGADSEDDELIYITLPYIAPGGIKLKAESVDDELVHPFIMTPFMMPVGPHKQASGASDEDDDEMIISFHSMNSRRRRDDDDDENITKKVEKIMPIGGTRRDDGNDDDELYIQSNDIPFIIPVGPRRNHTSSQSIRRRDDQELFRQPDNYPFIMPVGPQPRRDDEDDEELLRMVKPVKPDSGDKEQSDNGTIFLGF